jgi:hypothetical protein
MWYLLIYQLVDNYLEAREAYRADHFQHVKDSQAKGAFFLGGAFEGGKEAGLLFKVDDKQEMEHFVLNDPYFKAGLVTSWEAKLWNVVIGPEQE